MSNHIIAYIHDFLPANGSAPDTLDLMEGVAHFFENVLDGGVEQGVVEAECALGTGALGLPEDASDHRMTAALVAQALRSMTEIRTSRDCADMFSGDRWLRVVGFMPGAEPPVYSHMQFFARTGLDEFLYEHEHHPERIEVEAQFDELQDADEDVEEILDIVLDEALREYKSNLLGSTSDALKFIADMGMDFSAYINDEE